MNVILDCKLPVIEIWWLSRESNSILEVSELKQKQEEGKVKENKKMESRQAWLENKQTITSIFQTF